jgi:hypothetical protein
MPGARFDNLKNSFTLSATPFCVSRSSTRVVNKYAMQMQIGTVKFYNDQKAFSFIQPDDGSKDVFVHATALERAGLRGLHEG